MKQGKVKWFNKTKGFGFITNAEGKDVFVHHSVIEGKGYRHLADGEDVMFEEEEGVKGLKATKVVRQPQTPSADKTPSE